MRGLWFCVMSVVVFSAPTVWAEEPAESNEPYPLGLESRVLERDLTSPVYRTIVEGMIPTDLAAEWKRVATPDNYLRFLKAHGGLEKVTADPDLKRAYERRKKIADDFLAMIRTAYDRLKRKPPFDDEAVRQLLEAEGQRTSDQTVQQVPVDVVLPAPGAERQWPRLRGPSGQGVAVDPDFPLQWSATDNVVWKADLPGRGNSSPIVWDDRLFITAERADGDERLLLCFSTDDGKLLWQRAAPKPAEREKLYWKNTYASSTPVTDGERVIAFFGNSGLACYDFDGKLQWHQDLGTFPTMHGPGSSPVLYRDTVILIQDQTKGKSVFAAFDKRTGEKRWQRDRPNDPCWSTPVVIRCGGRDELIFNGSNTLTSYNPDTGEPLWWVNGTSIESIPMIVIGGGLLYSQSGRNGPIMAIAPGGEGDVTETHVVWRNERGGPHVPSAAYYDGRLFIVNDTGIVTCFDAQTGKLVWQKRLRGRFSMSPIEADGKLLLTNEDGLTYILQAGPEFQLLAENDLGETVLATPAVLHGRLYFRTAERLICIGE